MITTGKALRQKKKNKKKKKKKKKNPKKKKKKKKKNSPDELSTQMHTQSGNLVLISLQI